MARASCRRTAEPGELDRLLDALQAVTQESYRNAGRWTPRAYERTGEPCGHCGEAIAVLSVESAQRKLYGCTRCQARVVKDLFTNG